MVFKYEWSDKKNGNFAIKKRNSKGIRIEPKRNQQTKDSHYFILVNNNDTDSMYNAMRGLNIILETINFDYKQKETDKKSGTPFLKKEHIDNVLNNIEQYKNKTITIETASSKVKQQEARKKESESFNEWKKEINDLYDDDENTSWNQIMDLLKDNIENDDKLKIKKLKAKKQIIQLNEEIKKINNEILEFEKPIQKKKEKNENDVYIILKKKIKHLPLSSDTERLNFSNLLNIVLYDLAKTYKQREAQRKRVEKSRNEKIKNGIPKRKRGRPRKTNK